MFTNVHVFDGLCEDRIENASVLVDDNPGEELDLFTDPADKFGLIMKYGKIYKNEL